MATNQGGAILEHQPETLLYCMEEFGLVSKVAKNMGQNLFPRMDSADNLSIENDAHPLVRTTSGVIRNQCVDSAAFNLGAHD